MGSMITAMSLIPLAELPELSGHDKAHHLLAYGLLMFPAALRKPPAWGLLALGYLAWSGILELLQPLVNRHAEWLDFLANCSGLLCAVVIAELTGKAMAGRPSDRR
ncbi:MAG: VanZ family protein [Gammaproteobacteria bacterium]|nr:VanZ family protein [Gammaproteobacteria bacterium]